MDIVGTIVLNMCGILEIIVWEWGLCQMEFSRKKRDRIIAVMIYFMAWGGLLGIPNYNIAFGIKELGHMLGTMILFEGKWKKRLAIYWFSMLYLSLIYNPIRAIISCIDIIIDVAWIGVYKNYIISICTSIVVFILGKYVKKRKDLCKRIKDIPTVYYGIGIACGTCASCIASVTKLYSSEWEEAIQLVVEIAQAIIIPFVYMLAIGLAFTNIWRKQYKRESELKDEYLIMVRKHYDGLQEHMREVKSIRHDMKNHLFAIETYIRENKKEEALKYLQEIQEHQNWKNKPIVSVGNELVNAVLADGLGRYEDVKWFCEGVLPPQSTISDYDLCTLFSNMLSNGIEACQKISGDEKWISLSIKTFQNQLLISMTNPIVELIDTEKIGMVTSKKDKENHGFGVANMRRVVEKYDGELEFVCDKNTCQVKISMFF